MTLEGREWLVSDHLGPGGGLVSLAEEVIATATFIDGAWPARPAATGVATWSIREDGLQLRDGDGALQVDFRVSDGEV